MLTALQEKDKNKTVSITEPQSLTAQFNISAGETFSASKKLVMAIENLIQHYQMNQKLLNLLNAMKADAERFATNLESTTIDISLALHEFNPSVKNMTPGADKTESK